MKKTKERERQIVGEREVYRDRNKDRDKKTRRYK